MAGARSLADQQLKIYWHHPRMERMVTIIHLPEAPNPKVGPPTLHQPRTAPTYTIVSFDPFRLGGGRGVRNRIIGEYHFAIYHNTSYTASLS